MGIDCFFAPSPKTGVSKNEEIFVTIVRIYFQINAYIFSRNKIGELFFMEYAKDIILDIKYKKGELRKDKLNIWTSKLVKQIKNNKLIFASLTSLLILIAIDIILINNFFTLYMM